jgi:hypothetical protein
VAVINRALIDRYRCNELVAAVCPAVPRGSSHGLNGGGSSCSRVEERLRGLVGQIAAAADPHTAPADLAEIADYLRRERYRGNHTGRLGAAPNSLLSDIYYRARPLMPGPLRLAVQKFYLRGWKQIPFPRWPLDLTVEYILEDLLALSMHRLGVESVPFIWFWPDGASSAAILSHDVETDSGMRFCSRLMDIDDSFGMKGSFQVVPEDRYPVTPAFLQEIRRRGHEINVQDLNHDGRLFRERGEFLRRADAINRYARQFGARGFRAAVLYRNLEWYDRLDFEYDMSVPCVGHLEAQRGGCCTVFPYFIGDILELPVTATQDYSLFQVLGDYTLDVWKTQAAGVMEKHGLLHFIAHPDYLIENRAQDTYRCLLSFLSELRSERGLWVALPGEVNRWWRQRGRMKLAGSEGAWRIEGPGSERARIAYAKLAGDQLIYSFQA